MWQIENAVTDVLALDIDSRFLCNGRPCTCPIMHTVVIREELWKDSPWIAVSLFKAFQKAKEAAYQILNDSSPYKISMVWFREPLREQTEVFGEDPWPYGISKNRVAVETLMSYLYEQGLATRKLTFEEMFASNTVDL